MELGPEDMSLLERCPHFRGWYVQASMELGPEDVSLLEKCPHFRGRYLQASMKLGCPYYRRFLISEDVTQWNWCLKMLPYLSISVMASFLGGGS